MASVTRFVLDHVARRVQLLTRTEDPITEAMRSCEEVDVADSAAARGVEALEGFDPACAPTTLACVKGRHL